MRQFFVLWTGQALSLLGTQAVQFALIWWLTVETGSATVLATASLFGLAPQIVAGPFIGSLVDRWNRKIVMFSADALAALASLVLAGLFASGTASVAAVFALLLIRSICEAFHAPAMLASTSLMVPDEHLTRIQGLNQMLQGSLLIVTAPLGALLYASMSMGNVMLVDVGTAAFALVALVLIHVPQPERTEAATAKPSVWRDTMDGLRYLRSRPGHPSLLMLSLLVNLSLVPAFAMMPLLVKEWGAGPMQLGWMNSSLGIGMIVGGVVLGVWGGFKTKIYTTLLGLMVLGLGTIAMGAVPASALYGIAAIFVVGAAAPIANGPIQAVLQATVAPEIQGRIFTLYGSLAGLSAPVGLVLAVPIAEGLGIRMTYWCAGSLCCLLAVGAWFVPALLSIEKRPDGESEEADAVNGDTVPAADCARA